MFQDCIQKDKIVKKRKIKIFRIILSCQGNLQRTSNFDTVSAVRNPPCLSLF